MLSLSGSRGCAAKALAQVMKEDENSAILSADLFTLTGLERTVKEYPSRCFNVGIAEQNLVGIAAGMAKDGWNVFATTYANFITMRSYEQVRVNLGYMQLPVKLIGSSGGLGMGVLGNTHYAIEDVSLMRAIPNMTVVSPADGWEIIKTIEAVAQLNKPVYVRLMGEMNFPSVYQEDYEFRLGHNVKLRQGEDIVIFATGSMVSQALKVANELAQKEIEAEVINVHTIKPLNKEEIFVSIRGKKLYVTIEEHTIIGGLSSAIAEAVAGEQCCPGLLLGIPDCFLNAGSYEYLLQQCGLTVDQILSRILEKLEKGK